MGEIPPVVKPDAEGESMSSRLATKVIYHAKDIYKKLGYGHTERLYHNAMGVAFSSDDDLSFHYEPHLFITYQGRNVGHIIPDIIVTGYDESIIVELKEDVNNINIFEKQLHKYIISIENDSNFPAINGGLIISFNVDGVEWYSATRDNITIEP